MRRSTTSREASSCKASRRSGDKNSSGRRGTRPGAKLGLFSCPPVSTKSCIKCRFSGSFVDIRGHSGPLEVGSHSRGRGFDSPRLHLLKMAARALVIVPRPRRLRQPACSHRTGQRSAAAQTGGRLAPRDEPALYPSVSLTQSPPRTFRGGDCTFLRPTERPCARRARRGTP